MVAFDSNKHAIRRSIRVFISSTFRDMQAERDELVKRVFPQLRKLCDSRDVTWGEVDLRWGIPEEKAESGDVLPVCFDEINRCQPFFIGLLGERYGSVASSLPRELLQDEPWMEAYEGASITELEIVHGVLRSPGTTPHAFFYFRDPKWEQHAPADANNDSPAKVARLAQLKQRIRASGCLVHENYANPVALGQLVLEDFTSLIDRLFPEHQPPTALDKQMAEQHAFAQRLTSSYVERAGALESLDAQVATSGEPLAILGAPGSGKSALLANWTAQYGAVHPEVFILTHAVAASDATNIGAVLNRLIGEMHRSLGIQGPLPETEVQARNEFSNWLSLAAAKRKLILIVDGVDSLEDREGARELDWIPPQLPTNMQLIISTSGGPSEQAAARRNFKTMNVSPLDHLGGTTEREQLIDTFLRLYGKELDPPRRLRIAQTNACANPLFLTTLLEEVRHYGDHDSLDLCINRYLQASDTEDLFRLVLRRYADDYERDRPHLVRDVASLLWAARRGLSEAELLDILGDTNGPLPHATWSPLYLAMEPHLCNRLGLLGFAHDAFRRAAATSFLSSEGDREQAHVRIADYFGCRDDSARRFDELPWQLARSRQWQSLRELLTQPASFEPLWLHSMYDVLRYWAAIESAGFGTVKASYGEIIANPTRMPGSSWCLSNLLDLSGQGGQAHSIREALVDHYRRLGDERRLADILPNYGASLRKRGELDKSLAIHKESEELYRKENYAPGVALCLGNEAVVLIQMNKLQAAMDLLKAQEQLCTDIEDWNGIARSLNNQATIHLGWGQHEAALVQLDLAAQMDRRAGDVSGLLIGLSIRSKIHRARGQLREALQLLTDIENSNRELGNPQGLAEALENSARMLRDTGNMTEAVRKLDEAAVIWQRLADNGGLIKHGAIRAHLLWTQGNYKDALPLLEAAEKHFRETDDLPNLVECLTQRANIFQRIGRLTECTELLTEAEQICAQTFDRARAASVICSLGWVFRANGDLSGALNQFKKQERICREIGNESWRAEAIGNQAVILKAAGQFDAALALHAEEEEVFDRLGNLAGLKVCLGNQGAIHSLRGDFASGLACMQRQEKICHQLGDASGLAACLGNQAISLEEQGDHLSAIRKQLEAEALFRQVEEPVGLAKTLASLAFSNMKIGKRKEAGQKADEAREIMQKVRIPALDPLLRLLNEHFR